MYASIHIQVSDTSAGMAIDSVVVVFVVRYFNLNSQNKLL